MFYNIRFTHVLRTVNIRCTFCCVQLMQLANRRHQLLVSPPIFRVHEYPPLINFLSNSDFPTNQTFHQFHDLDTDFDLHRITSGFHGALATGVPCQQGTLTLPDTWFRSPFWDLLMLQLLRPNSANLPCLYSTFHLEYPLVLSRFCLSVLQ